MNMGGRVFRVNAFRSFESSGLTNPSSSETRIPLPDFRCLPTALMDPGGIDIGGCQTEGMRCGAGFPKASLVEANLRGAKLYSAYLKGVNLKGAHLRKANLSGANLEGAKLEEGGLEEADLSGANLSRASLRDADLSNANLANSKYNSTTQ